jgi:UDP-N-acetyl-D-mannosaminuronate dehydrogenase
MFILANSLIKKHQLGVKHQKLQEAKKTLDIVVFNTLQQSYKSQRSNRIQKKKSKVQDAHPRLK